MMDRRISTGRAAQKIGCSTQHVRNLIDEGELDAFQEDDGGRWRVSLASVEAYLERRKKRAPSEMAHSANSAK